MGRAELNLLCFVDSKNTYLYFDSCLNMVWKNLLGILYKIYSWVIQVDCLSFMLQAGVPASLPEPAQTSRDIDLFPGQPLQPNQRSGNLGVIGRSLTDLGAVGDNFSASTANSGGVRDQLYNLQMLEAAHLKLPQPKDSERPRTYTPVCFLGFSNPHFY